MTNVDFIKRYGKREFIDMCTYIPQSLCLAKVQEKIGGFKINNTKKYVKFYRKGKESKNIEFATIFSIGCDKLQKYLDEEE